MWSKLQLHHFWHLPSYCSFVKQLPFPYQFFFFKAGFLLNSVALDKRTFILALGTCVTETNWKPPQLGTYMKWVSDIFLTRDIFWKEGKKTALLWLTVWRKWECGESHCSRQIASGCVTHCLHCYCVCAPTLGVCGGLIVLRCTSYIHTLAQNPALIPDFNFLLHKVVNTAALDCYNILHFLIQDRETLTFPTACSS